MFIIYLFGFKNSFAFGEKYILATSFATLITDTPWDIANSIKTVAQIDIAKRNFCYKQHLQNGKHLVLFLIASSCIAGLLLYPNYHTDIVATLVIAGVELLSILVYPIYLIKLTYLQLEYSAIKTTVNKQISDCLRIICSFLPSPFCTSIGLICSVIYQLLFTHYLVKKNKLSLNVIEKRKIASPHLIKEQIYTTAVKSN